MKLLLNSLLSAVALLAPLAAQAQDGPRPALKEYNLEKGLALEGYDPVAYFDQGGGKPAKGKKDLTAKHRGVTYRFANTKNRDLFKKSPARFEPLYGGWCAYAMAGGDQVEVDPESFLIEDGRLLVFYKGLFNNTRKKWLKEGADKLAPKADTNWKKISGEARGGRDVSEFNLAKGLAVGGYDVVSYRGGTPQAGKQAIAASYQGVTYRFSSEKNKDTFLADAASYESHYGGWCAWAMSQGKKVDVDPEAFFLNEDGLFLFYNKDKRDEFVAARETMKMDADREWSAILGG